MASLHIDEFPALLDFHMQRCGCYPETEEVGIDYDLNSSLIVFKDFHFSDFMKAHLRYVGDLLENRITLGRKGLKILPRT